ncbi:MAG: hypothetical protein WDN45_00560 [Caulobacteraceae bacterium]
MISTSKTTLSKTALALLAAAVVVGFAGAGHAQGAGSAPIGKPTSTTPYPVGPTPRLIDGHPDLTGFWKPVKEKGKPGGNLGKDYPGFKLPFTAAGEKAHQFNLTKVVDPEAVCILGGIPRHNASGLPFEVLATPTRTAFLYLYTTHRLIPVDVAPSIRTPIRASSAIRWAPGTATPSSSGPTACATAPTARSGWTRTATRPATRPRWWSAGPGRTATPSTWR